jgi:hypothetical protein
VVAVLDSTAAARQQEAWQRCWQRNGGDAGSTPAAVGLAAVAEVWQHCSVSGSSRVAGAVLPLLTL